MSVTGLLLAAGAGRRMGSPKGLLRHDDGTPWVARAAAELAAGGCSPVVVVVGAAADEVAALVPAGCRVVRADGWDEGMGASLRVGLSAVMEDGDPAGGGALAGAGVEAVDAVEAVLVGLVDTPGVNRLVVGRLVGRASPSVLARARYDGVPGHPVLLGRAHWAGVVATAAGDAGARTYLRGRAVTLVECSDVGDGLDVDTPPPPSPA